MADRTVLDDFPVILEFDEVREKLFLHEREDIEIVQPLFEEAVRIARPKAVYRVCHVAGIEGDCVNVGGFTFESAVMAKNLEGVQRVFAYVVTCGVEVDDWSRGQGDYFVGLWLDMIKEMILKDTMIRFSDMICGKYDIERFATMNPGSGNADIWPITQQRLLFDLIGDVEKDVGVRLTASSLMSPIKSVSGILFPSESGYVNCALCTREKCPNRKVPYDPSFGSHE